MCSFRDDAPNSQEMGGLRQFKDLVELSMRTSMWRQQGGDQVWDVENSERGQVVGSIFGGQKNK